MALWINLVRVCYLLDLQTFNCISEVLVVNEWLKSRFISEFEFQLEILISSLKVCLRIAFIHYI